MNSGWIVVSNYSTERLNSKKYTNCVQNDVFASFLFGFEGF